MEEVEEDASEDPAGKVEGDAVEQVVADEDGGQEEPEIGDELQEREEYSQETGDSEQLHTEEQDEDSMLEGDPADAMYEYNEEPLEEDSLLKVGPYVLIVTAVIKVCDKGGADPCS